MWPVDKQPLSYTALLQVHKAKAWKHLHDGGHDPDVLRKLRTATDLTPCATKVTVHSLGCARSLGCAMSTILCLEFGPADSQVTLRSRPSYVPKVPTTPFREQIVNLQVLPPEEEDPALALLCPVWTLRLCVDQTQSFRT